MHLKTFGSLTKSLFHSGVPDSNHCLYLIGSSKGIRSLGTTFHVAITVKATTIESILMASTTKASWETLPVEIRQMILSLACFPITGGRHKSPDSPKVAYLASVCREWQVFVETRVFRRLVLDEDSLGEFDAIIRQHDVRLGHIRNLWLRIHLSKDSCPDCDEPEDGVTQHRNNRIFTTCLQSLLGTLKLWDPARHGHRGATLMLSASSPSDTEHRLYRCEIKDDYPFHYAEDLDLVPGIVDFHRTRIVDPLRRLLHLSYPLPLHCGHVKRAQGTPLRLSPQNGERGRFVSQCNSLPAVPMVKGLVMRRQYGREFHVRTLSWLLCRSFVALDWFRLERAISLEPNMQNSFDRGIKTLKSLDGEYLMAANSTFADFQLHLLPSLPKTLRQLSFTQWEPPDVKRYDPFVEVQSEISPLAQAYMPLEMARLCQSLEQLCPPWQTDPAALLQSIIQLNEEANAIESSLKRIILRCWLSSSDRAGYDFASMTILAAKAALSLPQLEVMELWGTCLDRSGSCAFIFRYAYEGHQASIVWMSSKETMMAQKRIIAEWSAVAQKHSHSILVHTAVPLLETNRDIFNSGGTCIYRHLLLKDLMLDPITRIILENEPCGWGLNKKSASIHQGASLNSNIADPEAWDDDLWMDDLGFDDSFASLRADVIAYSAALKNFISTAT